MAPYATLNILTNLYVYDNLTDARTITFQTCQKRMQIHSSGEEEVSFNNVSRAGCVRFSIGTARRY
jgi:hypothetical protein